MFSDIWRKLIFNMLVWISIRVFRNEPISMHICLALNDVHVVDLAEAAFCQKR